MVLGQKSIDERPLIPQSERGTMSGITDGIVLPGENNLTQSAQRLAKSLRRLRLSGSSLEYCVANDRSMVVAKIKANLIVNVARRVEYV